MTGAVAAWAGSNLSLELGGSDQSHSFALALHKTLAHRPIIWGNETRFQLSNVQASRDHFEEFFYFSAAFF